LKFEALKGEGKKNWGKSEGLVLRGKKPKEKASHRKPLGFHVLLNMSWGWGVFALAGPVVCNLSWFFFTCGILHEIQSGMAYTDHSCSSHSICKA
jgi:hypothetical protein